MMFAIYEHIPETKICKEAKKAIVDLKKWFLLNPKRRVCRVETWYGKSSKVRKNHIDEDINAAVIIALAKK